MFSNFTITCVRKKVKGCVTVIACSEWGLIECLKPKNKGQKPHDTQHKLKGFNDEKKKYIDLFCCVTIELKGQCHTSI